MLKKINDFLLYNILINIIHVVIYVCNNNKNIYFILIF